MSAHNLQPSAPEDEPMSLHSVAFRGWLHEVPGKYLTREVMLARGDQGGGVTSTPLHIAAAEGFIDQVPEVIRGDRDAMFTRDEYYLSTPLELVAARCIFHRDFGQINLMPESLRREAFSVMKCAPRIRDVLRDSLSAVQPAAQPDGGADDLPVESCAESGFPDLPDDKSVGGLRR